MKKYAVVLAASVLALTACSSGDSADTSASGGDADAQTQAKADIKASILDQGGDFGGTTLDDEQAGCVADGLVDGVGVDKLREYDIVDSDNHLVADANPTDLDAADADALASTFVDCVDVSSLFTAGMGAAAEQLDDEQRQCISDAMDGDAIQAALSDSFQGKEPDTSAMQKGLMTCLSGMLGGEGNLKMPN